MEIIFHHAQASMLHRDLSYLSSLDKAVGIAVSRGEAMLKFGQSMRRAVLIEDRLICRIYYKESPKLQIAIKRFLSSIFCPFSSPKILF